MTQLLVDWREGQPGALDELIETAYDNLCQISKRLLRNKNNLMNSQTQNLIYEAGLRLVAMKDLDWKNREHFYSVWTSTMRSVLIDRAHAEHARDTASEALPLTLKECVYSLKSGWHSSAADIEIGKMSQVLEKLGEINAQQRQIVELRYFAGLSIDEIAYALDVSPEKIKRRWRIAQTWLFSELHKPS